MLEPLEIVETKEFKNSTYEFRSDGITIIRVKDDSMIDMEETRKEFDFMRTRSDYLPLVAIVHAGKNSNITKEVREFLNTDEARSMIKAEAIITDSLAHKILLNFIGKLYKHPVNLKMFTSSEEGERWLQQYLEE